MTIHAQYHHTPEDPSRAGDQPTRRMDPAPPPFVSALPLLDHRTRQKLIPRTGAPAGRYLAVEDDEETHLIVLARASTRVGRGLLADVRLEDPQVSRRHAIIALGADGTPGARLLDDRSANGTFLNGREVSAAPLADGDVLRFGRAVLRYVEIAPACRSRRQLRRVPLVRRGHRLTAVGTFS
jgi:hypothetical protein